VTDERLDAAERLRRRALRLEWVTNAWNTMEVFVTVGLGIAAGSLALIAFGLDSLVEVFASMVVIWHLRDSSFDVEDRRTHRALRLIAAAFWLLAVYLMVASGRSLARHEVPGHSPAGAAYLGVTACVMFGLAHIKKAVAIELGSEPVTKEASMTFLDGCLSVGILAALVANITFGWWWGDATAAIGVAIFAGREGLESWRAGAPHTPPSTQ
jgi:divalent metal cation (Fe/Co/Zn/Cd) transporter